MPAPHTAYTHTGGPLMAGSDKRKQSLYFPEEMLKEIQEEATRQDRSLSWVVQQAWRIARERIKAFPAVNDVTGEEALPGPRREEPWPPPTIASKASTSPRTCLRRSSGRQT